MDSKLHKLVNNYLITVKYYGLELRMSYFSLKTFEYPMKNDNKI